MTSLWQKTLTAKTASAAGLSALAGGVYSILMRRPLPKTTGKLHLQGLHEPVEVITDHCGIPHIYAANEVDLFFAQGYVHAQERLWQMEFNRRLGSGRLSELFGNVSLDLDRFCHRLSLHRIAAEVERLPEALAFYTVQEKAAGCGQTWPPLLLRTTSPLERTFRTFRYGYVMRSFLFRTRRQCRHGSLGPLFFMNERYTLH